MYDSNDTYKDEFNEPFYVWRDNLDYDYAKKSNQERFIKDKTEYIHKNLDRKRWADRLDKEMFRQIGQVYESSRKQLAFLLVCEPLVSFS